MAEFDGKVTGNREWPPFRPKALKTAEHFMEASPETDEKWMRIALVEAERARKAGEVPVGAVIVREGEFLAGGGNSQISLNDPCAHAEILAIRAAAAAVGNYRLAGTTLYVTLEPCIMCAGAILHARIERLVFGAADPKGGAVVSLYRLFGDRRLNHAVAVTEGVLREVCAEILSGFFREKRLIGPS